MSYYNQGVSAKDAQDPFHMPTELDSYAHIEGLAREETRLMEMAEEDRKPEHHERLHAISAELDRIWEHLRDRAERHGHSSKQDA